MTLGSAFGRRQRFVPTHAVPGVLPGSGLLFAVTLASAALVGACEHDGGSTFTDPDSLDGGAPPGSGNGSRFDFDGSPGASPQTGPFDVDPSAPQTIDVALGQQTPTITFTASVHGSPVSVGWSVDRGDVGTVGAGPSATATFAPTGKGGGVVTVAASLDGQVVARRVLVKLSGQQDGANPSIAGEARQIAASVADLTAGGGVGGVGGEGLGPAVSDPATKSALGAPAGNGQAQGLAYLYPYDRTVWPRGLLAPLLQWSWSTGDADAIKLDLATASGSFSWSGSFGRPAILAQTGGKFVRHPIPQDVWDAATNAASALTLGGQPDRLTVGLTVARGGQAYGPIQETWTVAPARLSGTVYYNSYGTQLAKNSTGAVGGDHMFGGAVLSIHVGDTAPKLIAGSDGGDAQCRVCHSVAANGSRLVVSHGDNYQASSGYDLSPAGSTEHTLSTGVGFAAVYPDGSKALASGGQLLPLPTGAALPTTGLSSYATDLGTPSFSPDGKLVAINPVAGPGLTNPSQKLVVMTYDGATNAFGNPVVVADDTNQPAQTRPGWPAFSPDGKSIVFHHQTSSGTAESGSGILPTWKGAKAQIHWTSASDAAHVTPLNELNGKDAQGNVYLPKLPSPVTMSCTVNGSEVGGIDPDHADDVDLNYEPTVNPVASGGYAWVVFTSRRMYGSVAAIPPFCSDPRGVDLVQNITTKKLWVAAVDVNGQPGSDASHPAFYLPAQEILAGNSRAFWVLDPCEADGRSCETGDQCCGGYCSPGPNGSGLVCTRNTAQCSQSLDKCTTSADCCNATDQCVGGFCTLAAPR